MRVFPFNRKKNLKKDKIAFNPEHLSELGKKELSRGRDVTCPPPDIKAVRKDSDFSFPDVFPAGPTLKEIMEAMTDKADTNPPNA